MDVEGQAASINGWWLEDEAWGVRGRIGAKYGVRCNAERVLGGEGGCKPRSTG